MKRKALLMSSCLLAAAAWATTPDALPKDTVKVMDIEEVVVIASPKETGKLKKLPTAVSLLSQQDMQANQITSLKNVSALVPNLFIPDYGSRLTSAIYIRGIGSRINTPAVGLYVDNIPYIDKSAFDFNFYDIERIDVLRGPQGTLYGRNTMGGLIKVHTRSPFSYQGTDVKLGFRTKSNHRSASLTHYHRWSDQFAFSAGGYYEGSDGFFRHSLTGKKVDGMEAGGGRIRAIWLPTGNLKLDFTVGYDYTDEGGYPYQYAGPVAGSEAANQAFAGYIGQIASSEENTYRRGLLNTGLNLEYQADRFILSAVTGFQNLNDRIFMDQDFLPIDLYTIEQKQQQSTLSQEVTFKSKGAKRWQWVTGASAFHQWLSTSGPVNFRADGVRMVESMINRVIPDLSSVGITSMKAAMKGDNIVIDGTFDTPVSNASLFHQSTLQATDRLSFTLGLRLDYEHTALTYNTAGLIHYDFTIGSRMMPIELKDLKSVPSFEGKLKRDYTQFLPKFAVNYAFDRRNNVYATVSKGFRSGGYNIQMFSDLIQNDMRGSMMQTIKEGTVKKLDEFASMGMPPAIVDRIKNGLEKMPSFSSTPDVEGTIVYKPEYTWNYEAGAHLTLFNGKLQTDLAAFYMDTRDQQIAKFAGSGLGRLMVNAGRSESYGGEITLLASFNKHLNVNASYGYTHSTFKEYDGGMTSANEKIDYSGNYVPFVPRHTLNAGAAYHFFFPQSSWAKQLTLGMNYTGAGKIYWTENNQAAQSFYGTLNGRISLQTQAVQIDVWGRNLTNRDYTTFYFESMNRGFEQKSKPIQLGVDVRYHF